MDQGQNDRGHRDLGARREAALTCEVIEATAPLGRFDRRVAILIPAFNEAQHIDRLITRCQQVAPALIVVVDDGSTDDTASAVEGRADVVLLRNATNLGKQGAVRRGLRWLAAHEAKLDGVALVDGDGQHDPRELPGLARLLGEGYQVVIGARSQRQMPLHRRLSNGLVNLGFAVIGGVDLVDVQSGLRIYAMPEADQLAAALPAEGGYGLEHESLTVLARHARSPLRVAAAPIACRYGEAESSMQLSSYLELAVATIRHARRLRRANRARPRGRR